MMQKKLILSTAIIQLHNVEFGHIKLTQQTKIKNQHQPD